MSWDIPYLEACWALINTSRFTRLAIKYAVSLIRLPESEPGFSAIIKFYSVLRTYLYKNISITTIGRIRSENFIVKVFAIKVRYARIRTSEKPEPASNSGYFYTFITPTWSLSEKPNSYLE